LRVTVEVVPEGSCTFDASYPVQVRWLTVSPLCFVVAWFVQGVVLLCGNCGEFLVSPGLAAASTVPPSPIQPERAVAPPPPSPPVSTVVV